MMNNKERDVLDKKYCNGCILYSLKLAEYEAATKVVCVISLDGLHAQCPCKECLVKVTCNQQYSCSVRSYFVNTEVRKRWHLTNDIYKTNQKGRVNEKEKIGS